MEHYIEGLLNVFLSSGLAVEILRGPLIVPRNGDLARIEVSFGFWDASRLEVSLRMGLVGRCATMDIILVSLYDQ